MDIVDDPTLALITRFVGDTPHLNLSDAEFLLRQLAAIERYVDQFPHDEQQMRALQWIEKYARKYRQQWQKQAAAKTLAQTRCPDCPLTGGDASSPCAIHAQWLKLLRRYATSEISSCEYVEENLKLLSIYKDRLKVSQAYQQLQHTRSVFHPA